MGNIRRHPFQCHILTIIDLPQAKQPTATADIGSNKDTETVESSSSIDAQPKVAEEVKCVSFQDAILAKDIIKSACSCVFAHDVDLQDYLSAILFDLVNQRG